MKLARYVLFSVFLAKANANCECNEVDSWDTFKDLVVAGNEVESSSPQKIVLCPFKITKVIYENTDHWDEFLPIKQPMHITCHKQTPSDRCWIEIEGGDNCTFNQNCGRAMIRIRSSDVTIDGLEITRAKDNIIIVDADVKNIRIIGMRVFHSSIPGNNHGLPTGLISIGTEASVEIIDSIFAWNKASIVENKGSLLIHGSQMNNNYVRTLNSDGGAIMNKEDGDVVLTSTAIEKNRSRNGPAIQSVASAEVYDGGLNCGSGNVVLGTNEECNGVQLGESCTPLFGGECA